MFKVFQATSAFVPQGFQITFANGYMVSTMFGRGNYCANRAIEDFSIPPNSCGNAEIAVFYGGNKQPENLVAILGDKLPETTSSDDMIAGWSNPQDFAAIIAAVAELPSKEFSK